jgi:hypothetical protein
MFVFFLMSSLLADTPDRPDLTGRVLNAAGDPVRDATVLIYTAGPRVGVDPFCPSCYADCAKTATTTDAGAFLIRSLDPRLIFRVLVIGERLEPTFVNKVDPLQGPIEVVLKPVDPKRLDPEHSIRGRVVDDQGDPVVGAEVTPYMFKTKAFWGLAPGILDPVSVTNLKGEFLLTSRSPIEYLDVKIEARGFAGKIVADLAPGKPQADLRLSRGVSVTGRIIHDGRPLSGVSVGLVPVNRVHDRSHFVGHTEIATDESGRFLISNVNANDDLYVYGLMNSLKPYGAVPVKKLRTAGDGTILDVGDLAVQEGHTLTGRIVLDDGKPLPEHTRVLIGREAAWDSQMVALDEAGRFEVRGIPTEEISVSTIIEGYRLSERNACASPFNPHLLVGLVDRDTSELTILYERGKQEIAGARDINSPEFQKKYADFRLRAKQGIAGLLPAGVRPIESDYSQEGARKAVQSFISALAANKIDEATRLCNAQMSQAALQKLARSLKPDSLDVSSVDLSGRRALVLFDLPGPRRAGDGVPVSKSEYRHLVLEVIALWADERWLIVSASRIWDDQAIQRRERFRTPLSRRMGDRR